MTSLNNSSTSIIVRDRIQNVHFKAGISGLTRARFEVCFKNDTGKIKRRLIMLPGTFSGGAKETARAVEMMKEAGLLNSEGFRESDGYE